MAEKATEWIKENLTGGKPLAPPAPHVGPGGPKQEDEKKVKPEEAEYDADKSTKEAIAERKKEQNTATLKDPYSGSPKK